jgi:3,4-dihydroxy 2-butanone 4-phosphate synthase / GTP cyclohydrolase II
VSATLTSARVETAIAAIANGEFVVVLDREDRENEGDLIMAAELVTPEALAFMVRHTSGLVCIGMTGERLDELDIPLMVQHGTEAQGTAFTVSVDLRAGTTTGISAADRAATVRALVDPASAPGDFARPDGEMARGSDLASFAAEHGLAIITVDELIAYRRRREQLVLRRSSAVLPTPYGPFTVHAYESMIDGVEHLALVKGDVSGTDPVLVRVHSECLTGDVFGSCRCDCGPQLELALANIAEAGRGAVIYLMGHEGRGIGLAAKIEAYRLQDGGLDTVEANLAQGLPVDDRDYGAGAQILDDLGVQAVRLMTNNPAKIEGLGGYGFEITERVPLIVEPTSDNGAYLSAKRRKLGHLLPQVSRSQWWDRTQLNSLFFNLAD